MSGDPIRFVLSVEVEERDGLVGFRGYAVDDAGRILDLKGIPKRLRQTIIESLNEAIASLRW